MNERIFDMARQKGATDEQGNRAENVFCFTKDELKSFAELIVRECIEHLESSVLVPNIEHSRTKTKCVRAIKEHFGVE